MVFSKMGKKRVWGLALGALALGTVAAGTATPAKADNGWHRGWDNHHDYRHDNWRRWEPPRRYYAPPRVVYVPRPYYYQPPRLVYAPRPYYPNYGYGGYGASFNLTVPIR